MGRKFKSILETVGNTPVVKIGKLAPPGVNLYVKIEAFNPLGSVKDRLALERAGHRCISAATASEVATVQFPELNGVIPGLGRYSPCPWGLGFEIRGNKQPHWTGTTNSPSTFGHFGGAGTVLWVDPAVGVACLALTDRAFDEWADQALSMWPTFSDAVLAEASA
jgi:hypothetical protein